MGCSVCMSQQRSQIENVILNMEKPTTEDLQSVASEFGVTLNDLKVHMVMHTTLGTTSMDNPHETLARKCKLREADMLLEVANEYLVTLKSVGRRINQHTNDPDVKFEKMITKSITDLYLGAGSEIRATVNAIVDLDRQLHGPKNDANSGLDSLSQVLAQSIAANQAK